MIIYLCSLAKSVHLTREGAKLLADVSVGHIFSGILQTDESKCGIAIYWEQI